MADSGTECLWLEANKLVQYIAVKLEGLMTIGRLGSGNGIEPGDDLTRAAT